MPPEPEGRLVPIPPSTRVIASPPLWFIRGLAFALLLVAALMISAQPAEAAKQAPCWKRLVQDWFDDNRIDGVYPQRCYSEALKHLPEDVRVYSNFEEDAKNARLQNLRRPAGVGSGGTGMRPRRGPQDPDSESGLAARPKDGLFKEAFDELGPQNADSMPVPLMILGGLALLLLAGGAAGLLRRKLRGRASSP